MKMNQPMIKVVSSGKYVPSTLITNEDLEKLVETSDEWIVTRTGIKTRHRAVDELTSDMAVKAAQNAINRVNYDVSKIDLIIMATITGDQMTPSTANFIQAKLGLNHEVMSFDINAACTGFVYGLEVAASLLQSGRFRAALVIGGETLTNIVDYTDRNTCVLFGDGAGAMIIEPSQVERNKAYFFNAARGDTNNTLTVVSKIKMDGKKVYQFAVDAMQQAIHKVLEDAGLQIEDIDMVIPHQANERIIQSVSKSMSIPMEKFMLNLSEYGNTSAASIPITISEYFDQNETKNKKILLVGFGGGFTWGSAILQL
ncbi:MAG: 3-oxoacyl-ACP synthase [Tenericutes bacterium HGW-Tenericutes-2]|jgi:3-oxoacyl-[acyl-carrier-protein] synthase-3|nr:MAG: 3-oxoacyl-ACP synthase [Tenericutes bacterium HGW-Tenericutes-2]